VLVACREILVGGFRCVFLISFSHLFSQSFPFNRSLYSISFLNQSTKEEERNKRVSRIKKGTKKKEKSEGKSWRKKGLKSQASTKNKVSKEKGRQKGSKIRRTKKVASRKVARTKWKNVGRYTGSKKNRESPTCDFATL